MIKTNFMNFLDKFEKWGNNHTLITHFDVKITGIRKIIVECSGILCILRLMS